MEQLGIIVLWIIAIGGIVGGALLWLIDAEATRVGGGERSRFPKAMVAIGIAVGALLVAGCKEPIRSVSALRPDKTNPERFVCDPTGTRPAVPAEYKIDWPSVSLAPNVPEAVKRAKAEHEKFVAVLRTREGVVAGYILKLEGKHFICFNNMAWQRDFYAGLPPAD